VAFTAPVYVKVLMLQYVSVDMDTKFYPTKKRIKYGQISFMLQSEVWISLHLI